MSVLEPGLFDTLLLPSNKILRFTTLLNNVSLSIVYVHYVDRIPVGKTPTSIDSVTSTSTRHVCTTTLNKVSPDRVTVWGGGGLQFLETEQKS